jgi:hypothetical protein
MIYPMGANMRILSLLAAALLGMAAFAPASKAATINLDVSFTASNFPGLQPVDPVIGSFHIAFDPTQLYVENTAAITNMVLNINFSGPVAFSYVPLVGGSIGGTHFSSLGVQSGTDDFRLLFSTIGISAFTYSQVGQTRNFTAVTPNITFTVTATPIPASLVMLLTALGALGGFAYMRGRKVQPQAAMLAA